MSRKIKVIVVGLGSMGRLHAMAYHGNPGFEIVGLFNRSAVKLPDELQGYPMLSSFDEGLNLSPDLVSISTFTETHAPYALAAMEAGAHVFVEKPLALNVEDAELVVAAALRLNRKLVVGYILRHHPGWKDFVARARAAGSPSVIRMSLNQQSSGPAWLSHKKLLESTSPVVDCGVHYIDLMLQIVGSEPVQVRGMGARLSPEISETQFNYGQLQVTFQNGSIGWFESGWGPMISETAFFVQDVIGPKGSVSITMGQSTVAGAKDNHTKTSDIRVHHAHLDETGHFAKRDELFPMGELGLQELCDRQQDFVREAIIYDTDLREHMDDAVNSLAVVLAADRSMSDNIPVGVYS